MLRMVVVVVIATAMVAVAELSGEREVIFPEITALAAGYLVAPKRSWQVSPARMVGLIGVCFAAGLLISVCMPGPVWAKAAFAFALCQVVLTLTCTTFAPMISAVVPPAMLGTTSWVYPVSAVVSAMVIVRARRALECAGVCEVEPFAPQPLLGRADVSALAFGIVAGGAWLAAAIAAGVPFYAAPPLLVAFTELTRLACPARQRPWLTVLVVALSATVGVLARAVLAGVLGLPLTLAAGVAALASLALMSATGRFLPSAGAMATLPMLIPANQLALFPLESGRARA